MFKSLAKKALMLSMASNDGNETHRHNDDAVLQQVHDFEIALQAMDLLLDDRNPEGTRLLKTEHQKHEKCFKDPAAIFPLALGVMEFIEATLGFETEVMAKAHNTLSSAENASLAHSKYNQKHGIETSHIYPPGTEFQVTYAELTLLNALVMLLQENNTMMEQAKALLKLRKAYQILDATYKKIAASEQRFNANLRRFKKEAERSQSVSSVDLPGFSKLLAKSSSSFLPEDKKILKNMEKVYQMRRSRIEGSNTRSMSSSQSIAKSSNASVSVFSTFTDDSREPLSQGSLYDATSKTSTNRVPSGRSSTQIPAKAAPAEGSDDDDFSDAHDSFQAAESDDINAPAWENALEVKSADFLEVDSMVSSLNSGNQSDSHLHVSTIEEFIHSGVHLCFGILQVVLSLIPPTIGKVLSIVGFKGDREVGLHMLWRTAITARNIHGELALLCLLVFYDGPIQFIDTGFQFPGTKDLDIKDILQLSDRSTVTDAELEKIIANPNIYSPQLLTKARKLFPHNALWVLQEGRMHAAQGNTYKALEVMQDFTDSPSTKIDMQQIEALLLFDRGMLYAFTHQFDEAARDFLRVVEINTWSQAVYMFLAGSCYLEKWRMIQCGVQSVASDDKKKLLKHYADKAEYYLKHAVTYVPNHGENAPKKGGIGGSNKQMPFEKFVLRKTKHIEDRQRSYPKLLYIECVSTSLILELIYFWNGYNRMPEDILQRLIDMLEFSALEHAMIPETPDESMIRNLFQSICLRRLGKVEEGKMQLQTEVISKYMIEENPLRFHKMSYSPYLYPTALHERGLFEWDSYCKVDRAKAVAKTVSWLKKAEVVSDVGDYELSNRTSMRIKAATERLEQVSKGVNMG